MKTMLFYLFIEFRGTARSIHKRIVWFANKWTNQNATHVSYQIFMQSH